MTADLLALLDQLDEARAGGDVALPVTQSRDFPSWVEQYHGDGGYSIVAECAGEDRAALIVAAVNALPKLTAALRAVLERDDKLNHDADARGHGDVAWGIRYATAEIRDAVTAALTPEPVQP